MDVMTVSERTNERKEERERGGKEKMKRHGLSNIVLPIHKEWDVLV